MAYKIINAISSAKVPKWGNTGDYLAIHYLGVTGENHDLDSDGCGAHYYIYKAGTIYLVVEETTEGWKLSSVVDDDTQTFHDTISH